MKGSVIAMEFEAECFDDEIVVFALGESGDSYGADDSCACDVNGEAAAVGGVVGVGEVVTVGEGAVGLFEEEADRVGGTVEAGDDVDLALDPALIVGGCSGEGGIEERLVRLAEAADVDDDALFAGDR